MNKILGKWRSVDDMPDRQSFDGNAHFTYYDSARLLSFIWDGRAEWIEVSHGGYGEPVEWIIPAFVFSGTVGECIAAFEQYCYDSIDEWDEVIWDDHDYRYHEWPSRCAANYKVKGIPIGRPYSPRYPNHNERRIWTGEEPNG